MTADEFDPPRIEWDVIEVDMDRLRQMAEDGIYNIEVVEQLLEDLDGPSGKNEA